MIHDGVIWWCGDWFLQFSVRASLGSSSSSSDGAEKKLIKKEKDGWKIEYTEEKPVTPLLDTVNYPIHMKNLSSQVYHA